MPTHDPRPSGWQEKAQRYREVIPPDLSEQIPHLQPSPPRKPLTTGLEAAGRAWTSKEAAHLLKRTMFGVTKEDLNYFTGLTMEQAVDQILQKTALPPIPINDYEGIHYKEQNYTVVDPDLDPGQTWINAPYNDDVEGERVLSMKAWNITRLIEQERNIHAKMYIFWMNHFSIRSWDVYFGKSIWPYYRNLWNRVQGNFKDLVKSVSLSPAMLTFLNNNVNTKDAPDENFARELQELFTVGKGSGAGYTEQDVQQAARVMTGWSVRWAGYNDNQPFNAQFNAWGHDTTDKQFSSFYNNRVIQGRTGEAGGEEVDELLDMIFETQEVAKFICRKLYTYFVYHEIDAATEQNVIKPMADIFRNSGYEIKPVLETLFKSAHFYDNDNIGAMIKTPFDETIGFWRMGKVAFTGTNLNDLNLNKRGLLWHMANQGQEINDPPNVAGWAPFYQSPGYDKLWITTNTVGVRARTTDSLIYWGFWNRTEDLSNIDVIAFTEGLNNASDPNELIAEVEELGMGIQMSDADRAFLKGILLSGQQSDIYWTQAWEDYTTDPGNPDARATVESRLKVMYQNMFQLAEFQLM